MGNVINKFFALFLILILSPLILLISVIILIDDGFPIYVQENFGKNHKHFNLYKFRTMKVNTPEIPTEGLNDPKLLLKSGNFRKYSLMNSHNFLMFLKVR